MGAKHLSVVVVGVLSAAGAWATAVPDGLWEFNDASNPLAATVGADLALTGTHQTAAGSAVGDGAVLIGPGSYYTCTHGLAANGGGTQVNAYSLVYDFSMPQSGVYHSFLQTDPNNGNDGEFWVDPAGAVGVADTGYSDAQIAPNTWHRLVIVVNESGASGTIDYYLDGALIHHAEAAFWDAVRGTGPIYADNRFALEPASSATPFCLLFADDSGEDNTLAVSTVAIYGRPLLASEAADLGGPTQNFFLPHVAGATSVTLDGFMNLAAGTYDTVLITDVADVLGDVRMDHVEVDAPGVISSVGDAYFNYFGQSVEIQNITQIAGGYRFACLFQIPAILGGLKEQVDFELTAAGMALVGGRIEIPNIDIEDTLTLKNAYLEVLADQGKYGGGGVVQLPMWGNGVGGTIELRSGLGPEIGGVRLPDVTEISMSATGLDIPVGEIFSIYSVGVGLQNDGGLSNPAHWFNTDFSGSTKIVAGPKIEVLGRAYFAYAFDATGTMSPHDGSFRLNGTGLLFNTIETNSLSAYYYPPYQMGTDCMFNAGGIFWGDVKASVDQTGFTGQLSGRLGIPNDVPIVGGFTLASAMARLHNTAFSGSVNITVTPEIPSYCTPQWCPPRICVYPWYCTSWCHGWWGIPYPCGCGVHEACWQPPCIPPICTPAIPAIIVHFGFSFDGGTGDFAWNKSRPSNPWETPVEGPHVAVGDTGSFSFATNWRTVDAASTQPIPGYQKSFLPRKQEDDDYQSDFQVAAGAPGALFRLNYEEDIIDPPGMSVATPDGTLLDLADGALPAGFAAKLGYSRFNPDAHEAIICVLQPDAGTYTATVSGTDSLGNITVDLLLQDGMPWGEITSIAPGGDAGTYVIDWTDHDEESPTHVRLYLDHDREHFDGFQVAEFDAQSNQGTHTLDTNTLDVFPGPYFVLLEVNDGVNPPYHFYSHDVVHVVNDSAPEPPSNVKYLPDDGKFHISWDPSPTPDLRGYYVQMTTDDDDYARFDQRVFVPDAPDNLGTTVDGLTNHDALLVTVVAVDKQGRQSLPSGVLRIEPRDPHDGTPPRIGSTPDTDATVGFQYSYLPSFTADAFAGGYTWALDQAPDGMTVDAASGLVTWAPTADQEGDQAVTLRVTEQSAAALSDSQDFTVHVYAPELVNGLEKHPYSIATSPPTNAVAPGADDGSKTGATPYTYQIQVHGPTDDLAFELLAGPDGMTLDQQGLLSWDVPAGAEGQWVRYRVTAEGQHELTQDFYLHVHRPDHVPPKPAPAPDGCPECPECPDGCWAFGGAAGSSSGGAGFGAGLVLAAAALALLTAHRATRWPRRYANT